MVRLDYCLFTPVVGRWYPDHKIAIASFTSPIHTPSLLPTHRCCCCCGDYISIISRTQFTSTTKKLFHNFRGFSFSFAAHFSIGFVGLLLFNLLLLESLLLLLVEYTYNLRNFQSNSHHTIQSPSTYRENSLYFQLRIILWIVPQKTQLTLRSPLMIPPTFVPVNPVSSTKLTTQPKRQIHKIDNN